MRRWVFWAALPALALLGCGKPEVKLSPYNAEAGGLRVSLVLPKTTLVRDEKFQAVVVATNLTGKGIPVAANTGAPVYIRLWHNTGLGWEVVKRYPQVSAMVMSPWTLPPRGQRSFELNLTVEPDWPTHEPVRLTAELNGRSDVVASAEIRVLPQPQASP